jgi:cytochrome c peroxidase
LGKMLFFDPILSGNNSRSCASCHNPSKAFADGRAKGVAFDFKGVINRNTPTLINSGFQKSQFWDQRVQFLEDQITDVMSNPTEMHGNIQHAVEKIRSSDDYLNLFRSAFGENDPITPRNIQASLAWYLRSLQGLNSRFDEYMRGNKLILSQDEIHGLNLFMGKGKCGTCHFMPLFNGSVPPMYFETESEVLGVPARPDTVNAVVDQDLGKFHTYNRELHKNSFKTPTVRNASLTSPYMHNGVYQTLEDVMDFYNRGGGSGIGIDLSNQTIPFDNLNLSHEEQRHIISFLNTLTDTTGLTQVPKVLPSIDDKRLAKRKVGGDY